MSNTDADVLAVLNAQQAEHTPTIPDTTMPAGEWMPGEQVNIWPGIREQILDHIANQPRSLQKTIGPSELGTTCLHCLTQRLIGKTNRSNRDVPWLPYIGTAVHSQFEHLFGEKTVCEAERRVYVGALHNMVKEDQTMNIYGSIDLWMPTAGATIDWKIVGDGTLDDVRRHGPSQQYKIQASLYGLGISREIPGAMQRSCIYFLPRNQPSIDAAVIYETTFDPQPGMWALERAQLILSLYTTIVIEYGYDIAEQWADAMPRDPQHCFNCRDKLSTPVTLDSFGAERQPRTAEIDLAESLPSMPRALLKVPQAEYRPAPTNNQPTTNNQ